MLGTGALISEFHGCDDARTAARIARRLRVRLQLQVRSIPAWKSCIALAVTIFMIAAMLPHVSHALALAEGLLITVLVLMAAILS